MPSENRQEKLVVPEGTEPIRLDRFLAGQVDLGLSRAFLQKVIAEKLVTVNGRQVNKNFRLKGGETIELTIPPPETIDLAPEEIPLDIVYEDADLAVVNKAAGMVVHPAPGNPRHTLVNALLHRFGRISDDQANLRPGIIHRLDKGTSGLLLVAKNDAIALRLRRQMAERRIVKIYWAVLCGHLAEEQGTIDLPIGRSMKDRKKMAVTHVGSREAVTHFRVLERFHLAELVEVKIETGRTHQIRVHFAHQHRPVLGDPDYGGRSKWVRGIDPSVRREATALLELIGRPALHAKTLIFDHPADGRRLQFSCEPPDDMQNLLKMLRNLSR